MLGPSYDYVPDGKGDLRPMKRARNMSFSGRRGQVLGVEDQEMGAGASSTSGPLSATNGTSPSKGRVEEKNSRKLSCKECRRLKLKCDRVFPCQSCVKRGCASLCPDGALTSGRGSRFILAGAEQLHDKIAQMSERLRQLEEFVESVNPNHPLLAPELLAIKTSQELYGSTNPNPSADGTPPKQQSAVPVPELYGTGNQSASEILLVNAREESLRQSVVALSLNDSQPQYAESSKPGLSAEFISSSQQSGTPLDVPLDVLQLSATFPFPWAVNEKMRKRIRDTLPRKEEALRVCEEARQNALWQFNLDSSETFLPNLLNYCYDTPIENLSPRRLALLLMHLSIGYLVDLKGPIGSLKGEAYHHLARAAVCEIPLMEEPDFDVLHALFFMIWYHLIFSDNKKAVGYAWNLMGFVAKLAHGLGLHRNKPMFKAIPEEDEKRRCVFWELLNMDCRMALSLGRPSSMQLAHVDIERPKCAGPGIHVPMEEKMYHDWKCSFFSECLTPMLEAVVAVQQPAYEHIINLDIKVREFGVPPSILNEHRDVNTRFFVMQRVLVTMSREIALLQLHRRYFTEALSGSGIFDLSHVYAPSVVATYVGASNIILAVETLFAQEQQLSVRLLHFWFNSFSAAVTLALLVWRAKSTTQAMYALQDLERACRLFRSAEKILPFCSRALPVMQKLMEKSQRVLAERQAMEEDEDVPLIVPPSFAGVHASLLDALDQMQIRPLPRAVGNAFGQCVLSDTFATAAESAHAHDSKLPDIYMFSSLGISLEGGRYSPAAVKPTPFIPSLPRVDQNQIFNFDHGALHPGIVELTSYMAWF